MKYILTLLIISITLTATAQRNIYSPIYPVSVAYVNKTGLDSNFNFFMSQAYLDSLKFTYDSIKNHRTVINTLNQSITTINSTNVTFLNSLTSTQGTVANHGLTLATHTNQIAGQATQISATQVDVSKIKATSDSIVANWPTSSGGVRAPNIQNSNYTATQSDNGGCIVMNKSGSYLTFPTLTAGTTFTVRNTSGGRITFIGATSGVTYISNGATFRTVYYLTSTTPDVR